MQIAGGQAGPPTIAIDNARMPGTPTVRLRKRQLARLLGAEVADDEVTRILDSLEMEVRRTADGWQVTPLSHRFDISIEADLVEEVGRVFGYERVEEVDARIAQRFEPLAENRVRPDRLLCALVDRGYFEAITYSFVDPALQKQLFPDATPLMLSNPIAADLAAMRVSLWPGLLVALRENLRRQQDRVRLFEVRPQVSARVGRIDGGTDAVPAWQRVLRCPSNGVRRNALSISSISRLTSKLCSSSQARQRNSRSRPGHSHAFIPAARRGYLASTNRSAGSESCIRS